MKHRKRLYLFLSFGLCLCILAAVALAMPENTSDDDASRDASLSDVLFSSENAAEQILSEEAKEVPLLAAFFARMPFTAEEQSYLTELAKSGYAVIYVTENMAEASREQIEHYRTVSVPVIILIPGVSGNTGEGVNEVHRSVEKAVGSDIL